MKPLHSNSLILVGTPAQITELKRIINAMDTEPRSGYGVPRSLSSRLRLPAPNPFPSAPMVLFQLETRRDLASIARLAGRMQEILDVAARLEEGIGPLQAV